MLDDDRLVLNGAQLRAARSLLRMSAEELAARSGIGVATIRRAEAANGSVRMTRANIQAVMRVFEQVGVEFIPAGAPVPSGGPGVRFAAASAGGLTGGPAGDRIDPIVLD